MKASLKFITLRWSAITCGTLLAAVSANAAILQTVNEFTGTSNWNSAVWGTPNVVPTSGNSYEIPNGLALRTTSTASSQSFIGSSLQVDVGGILYLKHNNGAATANVIMNGGAITYHGGPGGTNSALAGTVQVPADSIINSDQTGSNNKDVWLESTLSGIGNFTVAMNTSSNALVLVGNNAAYSGNWTNTSGYLQIGNSAVGPLGSGQVILLNSANYLLFNATNNYVVTNIINGAGYVIKSNTGSLTLTGPNTFTGGLTNQMGTLVLAGPGAQFATTVNSDSVIRVADSGALPPGSITRVNPNNAQAGRLEVSNNVIVATGNPLQLRMRATSSVALESVSGNNVINDAISIMDGGGLLWVQSDAGSSLELAGGIYAGLAGIRNVTLQGAGTGLVSGAIFDNAASVSIYKTGTGTWTLNNADSYSGVTVVTNGVLKLGASGSIQSSSAILLAGGVFDATAPGGLALNFNQVLGGSGGVRGDVTTLSGDYLQVGFTNQFGQLFLSNNLVLGGGETIQFDVSSATNDVLNVAGGITLNGSTTIEIDLPAGFTAPGMYRLINYSGTFQGGGSFSLVTPVGQTSTFQLDTSTPGQVNLIVTGAPANLIWSGDNSGNVWDVGSTANWNSQTTLFFNGDNVTFNDSGSVTPPITVAVPVTPSTMLVSNNAEAYVFSGSTIGISASGSLIKLGTNLLAFASDGNTINGPVDIEGGTLSIGNGGSTGSLGAGPITNNGVLLLNRPSSTTVTIATPISGAGSIQLAGNDGTLGNNILNLSASNSYTGITYIETNSAISVLQNSALGDPAGGTVVHSGGRLGFTALGTWNLSEPIEIAGFGLPSLPGALYANTVNNSITLAGPVTVAGPAQIRLVNTGVKMTFTNTVIGNQTPLLCSAQDTGSMMTFSNTLSIGNAAPLTKDGSGTMVLSGSSNLFGGLVINGGTVQVITTNAPQSGDVTVNTGTLQLGSGAADGSMPIGAINLAGSSTKLTINSSNTFVMNNPLTGAGSVSLLNYCKLIINSSNTFTGGITTGSGTPVLGGLISLFNSYGLGDGTVTKSIKLIHAGLWLQGGLDIPAAISFSTSSGNTAADFAAGVAPVIQNISGSNIIEGNLTPTGGDGNSEYSVLSGTLTLNGTISPDITNRVVILSGAGNGVLNGSLNDNGVNIPALTKQGAGTWTLNNANVYSGATVVQNGTLVLGPGTTIASTPSIQIVSNATLDVSAVAGGFVLGAAQALSGIGHVAGSFNATGTVSPGPLGTLTFSANLTLSGATVMELNRTNAQNADLISAATVVYGGTLTVTNVGDALQVGDSFNLFDGAISGAFAVTNLPALPSTNMFWDVSLLNSQGIISVGGTMAASPLISQPLSNGTNLTLQVNSQAGFNYILQATSQLQPVVWTAIQTNPGGGTLTFSIPITSTNQQQFFRILVQ